MTEYEHKSEFPQGSGEWFVDKFNKRWNNIRALERPHFWFDVRKHGLSFTKFADAVLRRDETGRFDILITARSTSGGYREVYHHQIVGTYGKLEPALEYNNAEVFETKDGTKYLIAMFDSNQWNWGKDREEEIHGKNYREQLARDLGRYQIKAVFASPLLSMFGSEMKADYILVDAEELQQQWDEGAYNEFTSEVAMKHHWTNNQWLRFRATPWKLPEE